jgi:type IV pilus assembly protein PilA
MLKTCRTRRGRTALTSGFTLVELMITVAMVGVLATLALVGYRRYIDSAKVSEAVQLVGAIRSAEEGFRAETMSYLDVSTDWYPRNTFDSKKMDWPPPNHADKAKWSALNVTTDGPVRFGYRVNAGAAGAAVTVPGGIAYSNPGTFPAPTEPWYVVQARGDPGERGVLCNVLSTSFTTAIVYEND